MEYKNLLVEKHGPVAVIKLNNPPLNLLSIDLMVELKAAVLEQEQDTSMRCIVIGAEGKHFSGGADTTTFGILPKGLNTPFGQMTLDFLDFCSLPIIAAIHGACLGGGMEVTLACDLRLGTPGMKIGVVEGAIGIIPAYGGNTRLPWLIGEANAKKMFFTAARLSGQEALDIGLVQEIWPEEELMDRALELAQRIAKNAPLSNREFKRNCYYARQAMFGGNYLNENRSSQICAHSEDAKEGWKAFKEKRTPEFHYR